MKIAIACDGSAQSEQALELAMSLPLHQDQFDFHLLHVAPIVEFAEQYVSDDIRSRIVEVNQSIQAEAEGLLKQGQKKLQERGFSCQTQMISGHPIEELLKISKEVDVIAMGSRGMNPVKSFFLGSVSDAVIRNAHCSVLLWKPYKDEGKKPTMQNITVGFDDTPSSRKTGEFIRRLDLKQVKTIHLTAVMQMNVYYGMSYSLTALEIWPKYKHTLEESMISEQNLYSQENNDVDVTIHVESDAYDPSSKLNEFAQAQQSDLLVVGSQEKNMMDRMLLGSVSSKLAHHSDQPLLIVR